MKKNLEVYNSIIIYSIIITFCIFFSLLYTLNEEPAYLYDFQYYWKLTNQYNEKLFSNPTSWWLDFKNTINISEYNPFFTVFLTPFSFFGTRNRNLFIAGLVVTFLFPALCLTTYFANQSLKKSGLILRKNQYITLLIVTFLFTPFWIPTLRGYPDIFGLIPFSVATWFLYETKFESRQSILKLLLISIAIYLPFLIRKWYAIPLIAISIASLFFSLLRIFKFNLSKSKIVYFFINYFSIGLLVIFLILFFQKDLAKIALETHYAEAYIAFQRGWSIHAKDGLEHFGAIVILIPFFTLWFLKEEKSFLSSYTSYLLLSVILTTIFFTQIQGIDRQHYLPIAYLLCEILLIFIGLLLNRTQYPIVSISLFIFISLWNFINSFSPTLGYPSAFLLPEKHYPPLKLKDYEALSKLAQIIEKDIPENSHIAVFSADFEINSSTLENFLSDKRIQRFTPLSIIDERDGFILDPFFADYAVTTMPTRLAAPEHQYGISIPANAIASEKNIGLAYTEIARIPTISPKGFIFVKKKIRPFTENEIFDFYSETASHHPTMVQNINPFNTAMLGAKLSEGQFYEEIIFVNHSRIILRPKSSKFVSLQFNFWPSWKTSGELTKTLHFSVRTPENLSEDCRGDNAPNFTAESESSIFLSNRITSGKIIFFNIPINKAKLMKFTVESAYSSKCAQAEIEYHE